MGGTAFMFHFIAWLLSVRDNGLGVVFYTTHDALLPDGLRCERASGIVEAWSRCDADGTDWLVVKHSSALAHDRAKRVRFFLWKRKVRLFGL